MVEYAGLGSPEKGGVRALLRRCVLLRNESVGRAMAKMRKGYETVEA